MRTRSLLAAGAVLGLVLVCTVLILRNRKVSSAPLETSPTSESRRGANTSTTSGGMPSALPVATPPVLTPDRAQPAELTSSGALLFPGARDLAVELNDPNQPPEHDLEILDGVLSEYRRVFGQNPPGGLNAEITAALQGANARRLAFFPVEFSHLNSSGELVDRWGNAYYFHPVSRTAMEILSPGPDGKLWTPDDVGVLNPVDGEVR